MNLTFKLPISKICPFETTRYRGYYTAARRHEFYFRVAKTIFYSLAAFVRKILFFTRENITHISKLPGFFLLYG